MLVKLDKNDLLNFFKSVDQEFAISALKLDIDILGGASIVLQGFINRSTQDIDILPNQKDMGPFIDAGHRRGITVDVVTVGSTVDFMTCDKITLFKGKYLCVRSIAPNDLIKTKLERFKKQDVEDVFSIIEKTNLSYREFLILVKEMSMDFIGDPDRLIMHARTVVENIFPSHQEEFRKILKLSFE